MKKIQQGFTLIELMIVVAIIGILAAVAIPAYQDYIVKAKLSKVSSTLDPVKTALAMYYQEQGSFPTPVAMDLILNSNCNPPANGVTCPAGQPMEAIAVNPSFWGSLGFGNYPSLPVEVASMGVYSSGGGNIALILQLQKIKAGTIDGVFVSLSPNGSFTPDTVTSVTGLAATQSISGASAMQWQFGCDKGNSTSGKTDAVVKNYFKNGSNTLVCS